MSDSVQIEGIEYISSKRASELTSYTQDYIGQLSRGGKIDARRIGGLWYVLLSSLEGYKNDAEVSAQSAFLKRDKEADSKPSSLVFFDGKEYVSAAEGVKATGYHQDYIGQLARGGKIPARQVGTRWYVSRTALIEHKKKKDELLAAVQADSVGLLRTPLSSSATDKVSPCVSSYYSETSDLVPVTESSQTIAISKMQPQTQETSLKDGRESTELDTQLRIKISVPSQQVRQKIATIKNTKKLIKYSYIAPLMTIVIVIVFSAYSLKDTSTFAQNNSQLSSRLSATASNAFWSFFSRLEDFLTTEGSYTRSE